MRGAVRRPPSSPGGLVASLALGLLTTASLGAQGQLQHKVLAIPVVSLGHISNDWQVSAATLEENFQITWGRISVHYRGEPTVEAARFRAEYFDRSGRRCFSLVFTHDSNAGGQLDPFAPGETRILVASAPGLAPASEPISVRLDFIKGTSAESDLAGVHAPITIRAWAPADWAILPSTVIPSGSREPVVSLALALVTTDSTGRLTEVEIVRARTPAVAVWCRDFVQNLRFTPATKDGEGRPAAALVLIRIARYGGIISPFLARDDPWVRQYTGSFPQTELPVVNELRFESGGTWGFERSALTTHSATSWIFVDLGTDWCLEAFQWSPDQRFGGTKRTWRSRLHEDGSQLKPRIE